MTTVAFQRNKLTWPKVAAALVVAVALPACTAGYHAEAYAPAGYYYPYDYYYPYGYYPYGYYYPHGHYGYYPGAHGGHYDGPEGAYTGQPPRQYRPAQPEPRPARRFPTPGDVRRLNGPRPERFVAPRPSPGAQRALRPHVQPQRFQPAPQRR